MDRPELYHPFERIPCFGFYLNFFTIEASTCQSYFNKNKTKDIIAIDMNGLILRDENSKMTELFMNFFENPRQIREKRKRLSSDAQFLLPDFLEDSDFEKIDVNDLKSEISHEDEPFSGSTTSLTSNPFRYLAQSPTKKTLEAHWSQF